MPAQFLCAAAMPTADSAVLFSGSVTSGSVTGSINIDQAAPDVTAIGAVLFGASVDTTGVTLGITIGGTPMSTLGSPVLFDSNKTQLQAFSLDAPPTGAVVASFSGLGAGIGVGVLVPIIVAYSGVESVGTPVTAGATATTVNSVAVSSDTPAHRVVTIHGAFGIATNNLIADWVAPNNTLRARGVEQFTTRSIIQDAPGAATVTGTATNAFSNANWGAIGFDLAPAIVVADAQITAAGTQMSPVGRTLRAATPSPLRTWVIK